MQEVKVGQIWRHCRGGGKVEILHIGEHEVAAFRCGVFMTETKWKFEKGIYTLVKDAEQPLSDLEIVQKALRTVGENGGTMLFQDDGSCRITRFPAEGYDSAILFFDDSKSLLTWAKQTTGGL